jgi:putative glutamine amidotransferase
MKPIIGINMDVSTGPPQRSDISATFYEAIQIAGGVPILIPPMSNEELEAVLSKIDGIMTIGGEDPSSHLYGEEPHPANTPMHPDREEFDLRLHTRILKEKNLPALFICAGFQTMNIILGGSLIQDIPTQCPDSKVNHKSPNWREVGFKKHPITIAEGSMLAQIYGKTTLNVTSNHHQAIKVLGKGLKEVARADDGIIEAFEIPEHRFAIGVEWHPEKDLETDANLFREFVLFCADVNRTKVGSPQAAKCNA